MQGETESSSKLRDGSPESQGQLPCLYHHLSLSHAYGHIGSPYDQLMLELLKNIKLGLKMGQLGR